jgi:hypothetical protein
MKKVLLAELKGVSKRKIKEPTGMHVDVNIYNSVSIFRHGHHGRSSMANQYTLSKGMLQYNNSFRH